MGKRGKKLLISHEDRMQEIKKHNIYDDNGKIKKLSDPIWEIICNNLNENQLTPETHIHAKNLQSYVLRNCDRIKLELNESKLTESTSVKSHPKKVTCDAQEIQKSLIMITNNVLYKPIVQELTFHPFLVSHGPLSAISFISDLTENSNFMFTSNGSFCKSFISANTNIYLYTFGTIACNQLIPVYQMSSETISVPLLNSFFSKLLMNGLPIPHQVTVHHSWIHYTAINSSFNINVNYEEYLNLCFQHLTEDNATPPRCGINTDVRLLLLKIQKWDCIQKKRLDSVKLFYLYCVVMLSMQSNLKHFQKFLQMIFLITYSQFQSKYTRECFKNIMTEIKSLEIDITYSIPNIEKIEHAFKFMLEFDNVKTKYINYSKCPKIYIFLTSTFAQIKEYTINCDTSADKNAYYNPEFCKLLLQLFMEFTLWTKVMLNSYDSSIAKNNLALVDSYQESFKLHLMKKLSTIDNITVDVYLLESIEYMNNIWEKAISSTGTKRIKKIELYNPEISHMYHEENWGGLNKNENLDYESTSSEDCDEDSDIVQQNEVSSGDECSNNEIEFSDEDLLSLITSTCNAFMEECSQSKKSHENEESKNLDTVEDISYTTFKHNAKVSTSSPSMFNKKEGSLSKLMTLDIDSLQLHKKDDKSKVNNPSKNKRKRGKYLQPCVEIELINQKPLKKPKKRKVIQNYNKFVPKKINGVRQVIKTSSYFDCIVEIFTTAYYIIQAFQNYIDNTCSKDIVNKAKKFEFLRVLYKYVTTLNVRALYDIRVSVIASICDSRSPCYTWSKSIREFYEGLMNSTIYIQLSCNICNYVTYQHYNRIHLKAEQVINENLSNSIYNTFQGIKCENCKAQTILKNLEIKTVLCIDIENSEYNASFIELNKLISTITIDKQTMILVGIVGFQEPIRDTDPRHYIALCRNLEGSWFEYNDKEHSNGAPKVKSNFKINTALLFYIEIDINI